MSDLSAKNMNMNMNMGTMSAIAGGGGTRVRVRFNTQDFRKKLQGASGSLAPVLPGQAALMPTFPLLWDAELQSYVYLREFLETPANATWFTTLRAAAGTPPQNTTAGGGSTALDDEILAVLDAAGDREDRFSEIIEQHDAEGAISYYLGMLMIDPGKHPNTYLLIRVVRRIGEMVVMCLKDQIKFPRPSQFCPAIVPMIDPPMTSSYPSGHALQSRLITLALKAARPNVPHVGLLLDYLAQRVAENRIIAGLHFPSDNQAGINVADALFPMLQRGSTGKFAALVAAAAAEA